MDSKNEILVVFSTMGDAQKASDLARQLVEKKQVACVNIVPKITSIYSWKGEIQEDQECLMILKTTANKKAELFEVLKHLHPYETPEIIGWNITEADQDYKTWLQEIVT